MAYIDVKSKIALINKYIQLSLLRSGSKSMHEDVPENEIFTAIIQDLKSFNEKPEEQKKSLKPSIESLKELQSNKSTTQKQMDSIFESLQSLREEREEQENQVNLDTIIKDLESFDK